MNKMVKAVIFDLDGTLLNRDASVRKFVGKQYERLNKWLSHISKEQYMSRFIELDCRGYVWKDKVYQQMVSDFDIKKISWETLLDDYVEDFHNHCIPFPNLISMLEDLRDGSIHLGMITNGKGQFQMDNIRALGIESFFDTILVSEWEGIKKPNVEIFNRVLQQLNVSASESMYVGDHPENDVKGAKAIGMLGVWKRDRQWNNVEADFVIDDLKELPLIVRTLNRE